MRPDLEPLRMEFPHLRRRHEPPPGADPLRHDEEGGAEAARGQQRRRHLEVRDAPVVKGHPYLIRSIEAATARLGDPADVHAVSREQVEMLEEYGAVDDVPEVSGRVLARGPPWHQELVIHEERRRHYITLRTCAFIDAGTRKPMRSASFFIDRSARRMLSER